MTRQMNDESRSTPLGLWFRRECKSSKDGLCISNLDYILQDYKHQKLQLMEEKQYTGKLEYGQKQLFAHLDRTIKAAVRKPIANQMWEYWGFYVISMPSGEPGDDTTLNGKLITENQLRMHCNFEKKFCSPMF